jgi:cellulose biosynthesis protein BcsQ
MPGRAQCIAFTNHKGGTRKTTSCLSIAGYLAKNGSKVLVVDFGPQANATSGLGIDTTTLKYSMYDAVLDQCDGYDGMPGTQVLLARRDPSIDRNLAPLGVNPSDITMCHSLAGGLWVALHVMKSWTASKTNEQEFRRKQW